MEASSSGSIPHEASTADESFLQQSLLFSESLKDLKHLRTQLYSAAEYFEVSYTNDVQKEIVVNTLKEYTVKALVNTVDHLGSLAYKVTDLMDEKVDEVSDTELRMVCIEQRLKTCQECINHEGLSQQSLVMTIPKYHKRYTLPGRQSMQGSENTASEYHGDRLDNDDSWNHLKICMPLKLLFDQRPIYILDVENRHDLIVIVFIQAVRATIRGSEPSTSRGRSPSPSPQRSLRPGNFSLRAEEKISEKRTTSPFRSKFPLLRSGSLSSRPTIPNLSTPTTPKLSNTRPQYPMELRKSSSMRVRAGNNQNDSEKYPNKSKSLLKALLSRGRAKKDDTVY